MSLDIHLVAEDQTPDLDEAVVAHVDARLGRCYECGEQCDGKCWLQQEIAYERRMDS